MINYTHTQANAQAALELAKKSKLFIIFSITYK